MNATAALPVVGVALAKSVFQLAVADGSWRVVETHRLTRTQFERWFANRVVGLVVDNSSGNSTPAARNDWHFDVADSMSARVITNPFQMPDIRLQASPQRPLLSISLFPCGGSPYGKG